MQNNHQAILPPSVSLSEPLAELGAVSTLLRLSKALTSPDLSATWIPSLVTGEKFLKDKIA